MLSPSPLYLLPSPLLCSYPLLRSEAILSSSLQISSPPFCSYPFLCSAAILSSAMHLSSPPLCSYPLLWFAPILSYTLQLSSLPFRSYPFLRSAAILSSALQLSSPPLCSYPLLHSGGCPLLESSYLAPVFLLLCAGNPSPVLEISYVLWVLKSLDLTCQTSYLTMSLLSRGGIFKLITIQW